jgi:hypothetical protein
MRRYIRAALDAGVPLEPGASMKKLRSLKLPIHE